MNRSKVLILATVSAALLLSGIHPSAAADNFVAALSGRDEVPARATLGRGVAIFHLSPDRTELAFKLNVANIENVVAAHIHIAPEGVNGPVVVPLFSGIPGGGRTNGPLSEGVITAADLAGPLAVQLLENLIDAMEAGNAYVNVHTNDGVDPANSGPGDFPGGEIRGQIK